MVFYQKAFTVLNATKDPLPLINGALTALSVKKFRFTNLYDNCLTIIINTTDSLIIIII